ncbi:MAG: hypothetical protein A2V98_04760 [Planctomycetes bacterium RBG_16_64_12]|nr:MAG: hypothetical protein A2V98_04760 [Planctomycetes bacterium RBG_16_64_12]
MSQLFFTERGRALLSHSEEITRWRWARKRITLPSPAAEAKADLWLLAQMYEENRQPLAVHVNGQLLGRIDPDPRLATFPVWSRVEVPAGRLTQSVNEIEFRCDAPAMNAWMLAIEPGHCDPQSFLSFDQGRSWQNEQMGMHNVLRGEYLIRLRSHSERLSDPAPPEIIYENPEHPRVRESLGLVPAAIRDIGDPWKQLRALRTWVAQSWGHRSAGNVYTPWDPWTILDWAKENRGQGRDDTICMCVHFATLFAALAAALGHRARCVVIAEKLDEATGHFMTEVWDRSSRRWVLHDPNYDVHYVDGHPLSAIDLAERSHQGRSFEKWVVAGKGMPLGPARVTDAFRDYFASGRSFRHVAVWSANQYVSAPAAAPPNHGSIAYCETEIVWYSPAAMDLAPMFPYRASQRAYFDREP